MKPHGHLGTTKPKSTKDAISFKLKGRPKAKKHVDEIKKGMAKFKGKPRAVKTKINISSGMALKWSIRKVNLVIEATDCFRFSVEVVLRSKPNEKLCGQLLAVKRDDEGNPVILHVQPFTGEEVLVSVPVSDVKEVSRYEREILREEQE